MGVLTQKQRLFCENYAKTGIASQAYLAAGYKDTGNAGSTAVMAHRMLKKSSVREYLAELNAKAQKSSIMDIEEMRERLTMFARREDIDMTDKLGNPYKGKPSVTEATKAIELLGRMTGAFIDKQQVEVSGGLPIMIRDDVRE